jgi:hypothetical protein
LCNFFLYLSSSFQPISFQFDQHFFFHEMSVLICELIIFFLKDNMIIP